MPNDSGRRNDDGAAVVVVVVVVAVLLVAIAVVSSGLGLSGIVVVAVVLPGAIVCHLMDNVPNGHSTISLHF